MNNKLINRNIELIKKENTWQYTIIMIYYNSRKEMKRYEK